MKRNPISSLIVWFGRMVAITSVIGLTILGDLPSINDKGYAFHPSVAHAAEMKAGGQTGSVPGGVLGNESDANLWRRLRQGEPFIISDPNTGPRVVIQSQGEEWRSLRNGPLSSYGSYLIFGSIVVFSLFFLIRGRVKIDGGRSGRIVPRLSTAERMIHWYVASIFVLLAISGLIILYGKYVLTPLIGTEAFATVASAALQGHNLFGPLFVFGILTMFIVYLRDNLLRAADLKWLVKGGMFFIGHAPSWKYNFGEKAWFWIAVIAGMILSVSGVIMDFPMLAETRDQLQLANLFHGGAAVVVIAAAIGHIYLGTLGVEGALEGMTRGEVDENWAREHHDLWAEEVIGTPLETPRIPPTGNVENSPNRAE